MPLGSLQTFGPFSSSCCQAGVRDIDGISERYEDPCYMGVEPKIGGKNPKWMVKIMENPIQMDDFGGKSHYFRKHPYMCGWV